MARKKDGISGEEMQKLAKQFGGRTDRTVKFVMPVDVEAAVEKALKKE